MDKVSDPKRAQRIRIDMIRRMQAEANDYWDDARALEKTLTSKGSGATFLRILAFEILLKCAHYAHGGPERQHHRYKEIWEELPEQSQQTLLDHARSRMHGQTNFDNLPKVLGDLTSAFVKSRYYFENYRDHTIEEQVQIGETWICNGGNLADAAFRFHPLEVECFIEALNEHIDGLLAKHGDT